MISFEGSLNHNSSSLWTKETFKIFTTFSKSFTEITNIFFLRASLKRDTIHMNEYITEITKDVLILSIILRGITNLAAAIVLNNSFTILSLFLPKSNPFFLLHFIEIIFLLNISHFIFQNRNTVISNLGVGNTIFAIWGIFLVKKFFGFYLLNSDLSFDFFEDFYHFLFISNCSVIKRIKYICCFGFSQTKDSMLIFLFNKCEGRFLKGKALCEFIIENILGGRFPSFMVSILRM